MIDYERDKIIVTGGAGFIASHLVDLLVKRGARPHIMDDLSRGQLRNVARHLAHGSITLEAPDLRTIVPAWKSNSIVFHFAARVTNIEANARDHLGMLQDNVRINSNVIEGMRRMRPKLAVLCSTVCVYPHDAPVPTPESAGWPLHPEDTNEGYGLAKGILEAQAKYLHSELGIPVIVTRFSNAIGLRDYYDYGSSHVVPALIRRVIEGEDPLKVWGSGSQTRVFVDARELAQAALDLVDCPAAHDAQPINIGHDREVSICDLAYMVAAACGKPDLKVLFDTSHPDGHARRGVDNSRLKSLIGWVPSMPLEASLIDMVTEFKGGAARIW